MTMPDNLGRDPERAGAVRGALLIVVIGAALGVSFNALGLASRPRHGLAWIKQAEKLESLEALQTAPGTTAPSGESAAMTGASESVATSAPGDAEAATVSAPAPSKPAPTASKSDTAGAAAKHAGAAAPAPKKGAAPTGKQASAAAPKQGTTTSGSQAAAPAQKPAAAPAGSQPGAPAPAAATPPAATGAAATTAAADLPVIPDVPGPLKLELATLKKLYAANAALVLDAREAEEYADGHIAGATSLPYNDAMAAPERVKKVDPAGRPIVVYCSGGDCELSMDLAKLLVEAGKRRVLVYEGGFPEWQGAGLPVTKGANP